MTPTVLKRTEEIASIEQRHSQEVSRLKEEVSNLTNQFKGMQSLLKVLLTQGPSALDADAVAALLASPFNPRDANSVLRSSTSMYNPNNEVSCYTLVFFHLLKLTFASFIRLS